MNAPDPAVRAASSLDPAPLTRLAAAPHRFDFFQAVRLLARIAGDDREPARFRTPASLDFPASELGSFERDRDGVAALTVNFLGLVGPSGVLPAAYTELVIERRERHRDDTLHAFLDLFTHRLVHLFYRAWEKHRFYVAHERGAQASVTAIALDLLGLGTAGLRDRLVDRPSGGGLRDCALVYYAGRAAERPHSAASLTAIVGDLFDVPARLRQFVGRWIRLPAHERSALGRANCALGRSLLLGERVWESQSQCELVLGPLGRAAFEGFVPGGEAHTALARLVRWFLGPAIDCRVRLVLARDAVPVAALGPQPAHAPRLGYTTWLGAARRARDPDDVVFACP